MFENQEKIANKSLIVVCDDKERAFVNYLTQLIGTKTIDLEGFAEGAIWNIKEYRDNLAEISFMQKILFVGMNKYSKEQVDTIKEKYNKFGMHFGWLGTRAVLYVDDITDNIKDIKNFKSEYENFLKYSQKYDIEHKDILEPFIKENKKMFINAMTLLVPYCVVGRTTKIAYDLNKIRLEIKKQKYETLIKIFYIEGLKNFMEG